MLVSGIWHPLSRWHELQEMCPKYKAAHELTSKHGYKVMLSDGGEDHFVLDVFANPSDSPENARISSAFLTVEIDYYPLDVQPRIMATTTGSTIRRARDNKENIWEDDETCLLRWKHVALGAPKWFMLVRIPAFPTT